MDFGISTSNAAEAHLNQLMIECSDKVVILADSSKLNKKGFGKSLIWIKLTF
jgi:DeoR/GlpR family transcriptional regulator of sugar metabolism